MGTRTLPLRSIALAALAIGLIACSTFESTKVEIKSASERKAAPDFSLKDSTGATLKLSDFKGKVVLVNFWATWCGPCKIEIPWFMEFQQTYKDRDFTVVGVSLDEDGWTSVKPYVEDRKINYRVVVADEKTSQLFGGVEDLPTSFILDREGRIASTHVGLVSKSTYEKEILNLLQASKPSVKNEDSKRSDGRVSRELAFFLAR